MDATRQRRLAIVWTGFAATMTAFVLLDGRVATLQDALGLAVACMGLVLAGLYWYRPDLMTLGTADRRAEQ